MVKNKNLGIKDLMLSVFNCKTFEKPVKTKLLVMYNAVFMLVLSLLAVVLNNTRENYTLYNNLEVFFQILIGLPLALLLIFVVFYVFLKAFEPKGKGFWESYLVYLTIFLPFAFVANILNLILDLVLINFLKSIFALLIFILAIWYLIVFVKTFKNYFKTTICRVLASLGVLFLLQLLIFVLSYLTILIGSLA